MIRKRRTAFAEGFGKMKLKTISEIALTMFLLGTLSLAFSVQLVAADGAVDWWPMRGHDLNHTGYSTSTAPNTNHTIWNYTTGSRVVSSPAVVDGKVYVGSDDAKVYCLNASTGVPIWNYTASGSVVSSPAVVDGKVYVGSYGAKVYCLDAITGVHIWNYTTGNSVWSSPAVADGKVYVGSMDNKTYCLDASTGAHIWNYTTGGEVRMSSPAVVDGKVYVGSYDAKVYCLDASTGTHIWNYTTGHGLESSPAVVDGNVFVGSGDGKVYCLNAITGAHVWNYTIGDVYSSPAVADGKVYIGSNYPDNNVYALNATTGAYIWNYTTGHGVNSSPAVAGGKVYVGSVDNKVYCLDASTGTHIWNYTTGNSVWSCPAVADGKVFVGSHDGKVYAFGTLVWSTDSVGSLTATFNLTDNVYVRGEGFTADTNVTIYLLPDGEAALPSNAVANASAITNSTGGLPVTLVWSQPLTLGEYDIWVDANQNGMFDGGDVWNSQAVGIYGFDVIPEFLTWTSILLVLSVSTVSLATYKRKLLKKPIH